MIIRSEEFKLICSKILTAAESNALAPLTDTVELRTENNYLYINVTNKEYFASCKLDVGVVEAFHATVNADLFLKLIAQITTDTIELSIRDTHLIIKANGTYKLPMIFSGEELIELPRIEIQNPTSQFNIDSNILLSILQYNSKELTKGAISKAVQKYYYVDAQGALTFTSSTACVNSFMLPQDIQFLLSDRIVKLFKLFKGENVVFTLGFDSLSESITLTKVRFESETTCITAIISCDDSILRSVPATGIRGRANYEYPYSITVNKDAMLQTINRLILFAPKDTINLYSKCEFKRDCVIVYDLKGEMHEEVYYTGNTINDEYDAVLDFITLKTTLESCTEPYINIHFGNGAAFVIARGNIKNIISEIHSMDMV